MGGRGSIYFEEVWRYQYAGEKNVEDESLKPPCFENIDRVIEVYNKIREAQEASLKAL